MRIYGNFPAALLLAGSAAIAGQPTDTGPTGAAAPGPMAVSPSGSSYVYRVPAADVAKAIGAAKAATTMGQPYFNGEPFLHLLFRGGPNMISLENRPSAAPEFTLHEAEYELFYVLEGSGKLYTGGTLVRSPDSPNSTSAKAAIGGIEVTLSKGDVIMIPPNTVHSVTQSDGNLVLFTVHMPATSAAATR